MQELDNQIISLFQEMGHGQGMKDSLMMTLFAKIYLSPEPIAMDDLAKETGYSLASISNKVNMLAPIMHIKKTKKPGSKKIFLSIEKNILNIWKDAMTKKQEFVINNVKEKLPPILKEYKSKAKTDEEKNKIKIMENYYGQILKFETIINKMLMEFNNLK